MKEEVAAVSVVLVKDVFTSALDAPEDICEPLAVTVTVTAASVMVTV